MLIRGWETVSARQLDIESHDVQCLCDLGLFINVNPQELHLGVLRRKLIESRCDSLSNS